MAIHRFVGQLIAGVNYVRPHWGVYFNIWLTTHTVASHSLTSVSDNANNFGAIRFDWRF